MHDPVAVTSTATQITFTAADIEGNGSLYLQNRGPAEVFVGSDGGVTSANGLGLGVLQIMNPWADLGDGLSSGQYSLWVVTAAGATAEVRPVIL